MCHLSLTVYFEAHFPRFVPTAKLSFFISVALQIAQIVTVFDDQHHDQAIAYREQIRPPVHTERNSTALFYILINVNNWYSEWRFWRKHRF